ncbi:MAG TPA: sulfotransferase [Candidatus Binataceae bacterium]|nr:sulfotransferase [Candidatus Binataceae bacterium]
MSDASRLPDFIAVGPQRTGTTWLHEVMKSHLGLPRGIKETDFFLKNYAKGMAWYREFFRDYPPAMLLGEIDPNYFGEDLARERIANDIPRAKIILTLRDPVGRAWSSYRVMRRDAWTRVGFEETVTNNRIIRESSRYAHHLANWQKSFSADRVLVCLYDDLEAAPQKFLDTICDFIGAARIRVDGAAIASERVNTVTHAPRSRKLAQNARNARDWMRVHRWHRAEGLLERAGVWRFCFGGGEEFGALDPEVDARLRAHFRPEVEALERLIGRDLSAWKTSRAEAPPIRSSAVA